MEFCKIRNSPENSVIVVKHLPEGMTVEDRKRLFTYLGATEVKCINSKWKKSSLVFARFKTQEIAGHVINSLHQTEVAGHRLSAEYVKQGHLDEYARHETKRKQEDTETKAEKPLEHKLMENFIQKLNSWLNEFDFNLPPPAHLKYSYPPPSLLVLKNICKALSRVPKFYTQVLHLMNKMNLPCPFVEDFKILDEKCDTIQQEDLKDEPIEESEEESELDDETPLPEQSLNPSVQVQRKRKLKRKRPLFVPNTKAFGKKPKTETTVKPEEVFEIHNAPLVKKGIEIHLPPELTKPEKPETVIEPQGFELMETQVTEPVKEVEIEDIPEENEELDKVITEQELSTNRIPPKDFHLLPVFKNYQPGQPSCRLYIKNLGKTVETSNLKFIYKRYVVDQVEEQGSMFDIRLMQEGRMKGQAFVTLQNVSLAEKALKETNGFLLKGKPMVVQFARSAVK